MRPQTLRKLHLSDAIILIAATAPAFASMRLFLPVDLEWMHAYNDKICYIKYIVFILSHIPAMWSPVCVILRLRRPRRALRRLTRQPGFTDCAAASIILVVKLVALGFQLGVLALDWGLSRAWGQYIARYTEPIYYHMIHDDWQYTPAEIGGAVAAVWIIQAIGGRWRPEARGIDRLGTVLGGFWLFSLPFTWFVYWAD